MEISVARDTVRSSKWNRHVKNIHISSLWEAMLQSQFLPPLAWEMSKHYVHKK